MGILDFFVFLGGIGLFLYGIKIMGEGLEAVAGNRLKNLLDKVTANKFLALLVGALVTAVIQSSSATTVMVVGFVNAGLMNLAQATSVIMGANIGTTITSVFIALNLTDIAPLLVFCGALLIVFSKKKNITHIGELIAGFGLLFIGMSTMSGAMSPLKDSAVFQRFLTENSNPFVGVLIGLVFTAIIQSSSASVGILQALAFQGLVPINFAVYVLYGQNIGTVVTTLMSAAGSKANSKRAAVIHLLFNVFGTIFFVLISLFTPYIRLLELISDNTVVQISAAHIIFNVVSTILLFPFSNILVKIACKLVPGRTDKPENTMQLTYLDERILSTPAFAVSQVTKEVLRMAEIARDNFAAASKALIEKNDKNLETIFRNEETVNYLNHSITAYLVKINELEISEEHAEYIGKLFHVVNDLERISDHATNLAEATQDRIKNDPRLSGEALSELKTLRTNVLNLIDDSVASFKSQKLTVQRAKQIHHLEEYIDDLKETYNSNHIVRMNKQLCDTKAGMLFINTLTDFERTADHAYNIAFAVKDPPDVRTSVS